MIIETLTKCPHCGALDLKFVHTNGGGFYECHACGYKGSLVHQEEKETDHMISW
ncbi:MAG: hypothetical protein KKE20_00545 [Nanoarchaeota archaeon]|nr:hypothetical protein [Nanoarchaeota archaeon]